MRCLRLGLAQMNPTVGDLDGNVARIVAAIERARAAGVEVLALPELAVTGYPPEDLLLQPAFVDRTRQRTLDLLPHTTGLTVVVGTLDRGDVLFDAAAVLHDGTLAGVYHKHRLPNYGVFDEKRYFAPGGANVVFGRGDTTLGVSICEDIWFPGDPIAAQAAPGGAEVLLNLSASPYHAGKAGERRRMLAARAAEHRAFVAYVNLVGGQDEVLHDGASLVLGPRGEVLAEAAMFAEDLLVVDLDLDAVRSARAGGPLPAAAPGAEHPRRKIGRAHV
jgi:NAD+ synthase (glutamine-hydrolysing)